MADGHYVFKILDDMDMGGIEESLSMSIVAVGGIYGRARIHLEARFEVERDERICRIGSGSEVGDAIARVFTELLLLECESDGFELEHRPEACRGQAFPDNDWIGR